MDDEVTPNVEVSSVGETLRAARKKKKLSLEDIAARTRIPLRHLESLEAGDWQNLPAPTYSVGFAKNYAGVVGLDRDEIGERLRTEMGGTRPAVMAPAEVFEPADPARAMPKWLVLGALLAVLVVAGVMSWLNNRSLSGGEDAAVNNATVAAPAPTAPAAPAPAAQGPVVLSAREPLWMAVYDLNGTSFFSGTLNPGTDFTVPTTATAPLLKTAKPEALKIMVGTAEAPPVGTPGAKVSDVSLLPQDLMKNGAAPAATSTAATGPSATTPAAAPKASSAPRRTASKAVTTAPKATEPAPAPEPTTPQANMIG